MRTPVICKNCGLKWVRVSAWGGISEPNEDLQYYCPRCSSNWYEPVTEANTGDATEPIKWESYE